MRFNADFDARWRSQVALRTAQGIWTAAGLEQIRKWCRPSGFPSGAKQAAEKRQMWSFRVLKGIPQGLKPTHSMQLIGTTEVVPFQNGGQSEFFRKL
jgi:hypothetical protein